MNTPDKTPYIGFKFEFHLLSSAIVKNKYNKKDSW